MENSRKYRITDKNTAFHFFDKEEYIISSKLYKIDSILESIGFKFECLGRHTEDYIWYIFGCEIVIEFSKSSDNLIHYFRFRSVEQLNVVFSESSFLDFVIQMMKKYDGGELYRDLKIKNLLWKENHVKNVLG